MGSELGRATEEEILPKADRVGLKPKPPRHWGGFSFVG